MLILQCNIKNNKHRLGGTFTVKATYKSRETKTTDITPEFTAGRLTNYGGLVPFADFLGETLPGSIGPAAGVGNGPQLHLLRLADIYADHLWLPLRAGPVGPFRAAQLGFPYPEAAGSG